MLWGFQESWLWLQGTVMKASEPAAELTPVAQVGIWSNYEPNITRLSSIGL